MHDVAQVRRVEPVRSLAGEAISAQDKARQKAKRLAFKQAGLQRRQRSIHHASLKKVVARVVAEVTGQARVLQENAAAAVPMLQAMVDATPVRQLSAVRERMEQRAVEAVLQGTTWLTAQQVGRRHNPQAANPHAAASRWQQAGKVFAIERAGQRLYPSYLFDELGQPLPAVPQILQALAGRSPFRVAAWFESTSSMLGGRRPREVLASDPAAVIAAAREHAIGPVHG